MTEAYLRERKNLKGMVCILDMRRRPDHLDIGLFSYLKELGIEAVALINKADKVPQPRRKKAIQSILSLLPPLRHPTITVSAKTGEGFQELSYFLCSFLGVGG